jgi:hypothetical protein
MAKGEKSQTIETVGELKRFLAGLPDDMSVCVGCGDETLTAIVWKPENKWENGGRKWVGLEDGWDD